MFWSLKNSGEVLSKLKTRRFRATSLSKYDFTFLFTTLPHNLINEKLLDLIELVFKREERFILPVTLRTLFSLLQTTDGIYFGLVRMFVTPYRISEIIFTLNLVLSYTDYLWYSVGYKLCSSCSRFAKKEIS